MATTEQEMLLNGLLQLIEVSEETPVDDNKDNNEATEAPAPKRQYTFRRGDYTTGQPEAVPVNEVEAKAEEPSVVQPDTKKPVVEPEKSYIVSPDKLESFSDMMRGGEKAEEPSPAQWWEAQSNTNKIIYSVIAAVVSIALFAFVAWSVNFMTGGKQYAARPTSVVQTAAPALGAGAMVPTTLVEPTSAPTTAPVASGGTCEGYQYYHSPDVSDIGPCVGADDAVIPTGVYGTDGVWLFMILPSGESKWVKAETYGYTAAQVQAMKLKDYQAVAMPAPQPAQQPAPPAEQPWVPSDGVPPPAPTATAVPEPTPAEVTPGCNAETGLCTKPGREKPGSTTTGTKPSTGSKVRLVDPSDVNTAHP